MVENKNEIVQDIDNDVIDHAVVQNENVSEEYLGHQPSVDSAQQEENGVQHESSSSSNSEHLSQDDSDSSIVADGSAVDDQGVPKWGIDDPIAWGKYKERKVKKEFEKKEKERDLQLQKIQEELQQYKFQANQSQQSYNHQSEDNNLIQDPITGMLLDRDSDEGKEAERQGKLEAARQGYVQQQIQNEYQVLKKQREAILEEEIEQAKFKYNDFEKVINNCAKKGLYTQEMIDFSATLPNNQADFIYYLSKNENALRDIVNMSPYSRYIELQKHSLQFHKGGSRVSKAPDPVKPLSGGSRSSSVNVGTTMESAKAAMRAKYCK